MIWPCTKNSYLSAICFILYKCYSYFDCYGVFNWFNVASILLKSKEDYANAIIGLGHNDKFVNGI